MWFDKMVCLLKALAHLATEISVGSAEARAVVMWYFPFPTIPVNSNP